MSSNEQVIALDVGERRIGVALADKTVKIPVALTTIVVDGTETDHLGSLISEHHVKHVIVGYPRNQQGAATAQTKYVEQFVKKLSHLKVTIWFQDESLTSVMAEQRLRSYNKPYTKADIDAYATTIILQDYLEHPAGAIQARQSATTNTHKYSGKVIAVGVVIGGIFLVIMLAIGAFYIALQPRNSQGQHQRVVISAGSGTAMVGQQLKDQGIIKSALAFQLYLRLKGSQASLQAGTYALSPVQSTPSIVEHLIEGNVDVLKVTVSPGQTVSELRKSLRTYGFSDSDISDAFSAKSSYRFLGAQRQGDLLEGYVYPETYQIPAGSSAHDLIQRSLDEFSTVLEKNDIVNRLARQNLSVEQGIILASVVQKEVSDSSEQKQVAQVFLSRFRQGMVLGSDVTFIYGASILGVEPRVTLDSPYNTRIIPGLPPGPIANFNLSALTAVADPAPGDYIYFVAGDNGKTYFAHTLAEHEDNVRKYCQKLCEMY